MFLKDMIGAMLMLRRIGFQTGNQMPMSVSQLWPPPHINSNRYRHLKNRPHRAIMNLRDHNIILLLRFQPRTLDTIILHLKPRSQARHTILHPTLPHQEIEAAQDTKDHRC
jgi:hypothetical protein